MANRKYKNLKLFYIFYVKKKRGGGFLCNFAHKKYKISRNIILAHI